MKKAFATLAATGVLSLAALAGTATTASAATASPASGIIPIRFSTWQDCEWYVQYGTDTNEWGVWDCELVSGPYGGWYIFTP
jgi:hypothetical protein